MEDRMEKKMRLSHSQISMYSGCGKKYEYHYIKKLREYSQSAALLFGSALDNTINQVLLDKKNEQLKEIEYYTELFRKHWTFAEINKKMTELRKTDKIAYASGDLDMSLLFEDDAKELGFTSIEKLTNYYKYVYNDYPGQKKKRLEELSQKDKELVQEVNWRCLKAKGEILLQEYWNELLPKIVKVYEVQKTVNLTNSEGDSVMGIVDAVLDFGDGPVICDLKTSSRRYTEDSASKSPQLAVYKHALQEQYPNAQTAFMVLYKKIEQIIMKVCTKCANVSDNNRLKKCDEQIDGARCNGEWKVVMTHSGNSALIFGKIDDNLEHNVVENYDTILRGIKAGIFYRNWDHCEQGYGNCPYLMLCRKNKDDKLIKVE